MKKNTKYSNMFPFSKDKSESNKEKLDLLKNATNTTRKRDSINKEQLLNTEIKKLKKKIQRLESENRNLVRNYNNDTNRLKDEFKKTNNRLIESQKENKQIEQMLNEANLLIERKTEESVSLTYTNESLSEQLERMSDNVILDELKKARAELDKYSKLYNDEVEDHKHESKLLKNKIAELRKKSEINNFTFSRDLNDAKMLNKKLSSENLKLLAEMDSLERTVPSAAVLKRLKDQMNINNFHVYSESEKILEKYNLFKKVKAELIRKEREEEKAKKRSVKKSSVLGYVVKNQNDWYFYDLENNLYSVLAYTPKYLVEDIPAYATIYEDKFAYVQYCLFDQMEHSNSTKQDQKRNKYKVDNSDEERYAYFGNFSVLIIGSMNSVHYTKRLSLHGLNVDHYDSYEKSLTGLSDKVKSYDIVLVCARHSRHGVFDHVDRYADNVEVLENDNEDKIAIRTRYCAIKLGLIKFDHYLEYGDQLTQEV
ncbi:hypothetical protein [Paenibacillus polymyxa]|uniref:coiled-coil domain-containing protein n=1 Tax=Paenibacillus polymyxa TaxID=1406 RepID=UPI002ED63F88|nr:hypothetical protein [Paenibacillus polymyxa]